MIYIALSYKMEIILDKEEGGYSKHIKLTTQNTSMIILKYIIIIDKEAPPSCLLKMFFVCLFDLPDDCTGKNAVNVSRETSTAFCLRAFLRQG